jgi:hypothetical protein
LLWKFVDACARGQLGLSECGPVFQVVVIGVLLIIAVCALVWLVLSRKVK